MSLIAVFLAAVIALALVRRTWWAVTDAIRTDRIRIDEHVYAVTWNKRITRFQVRRRTYRPHVPAPVSPQALTSALRAVQDAGFVVAAPAPEGVASAE